MPIQKKSIYYKTLSWGINEIWGSGLLAKMKSRHSKTVPNCSTNKAEVLGFEKLVVLFCLLILGCFMALFLLWIETTFPSLQAIQGWPELSALDDTEKIQQCKELFREQFKTVIDCNQDYQKYCKKALRSLAEEL